MSYTRHICKLKWMKVTELHLKEAFHVIWLSPTHSWFYPNTETNIWRFLQIHTVYAPLHTPNEDNCCVLFSHTSFSHLGSWTCLQSINTDVLWKVHTKFLLQLWYLRVNVTCIFHGYRHAAQTFFLMYFVVSVSQPPSCCYIR